MQEYSEQILNNIDAQASRTMQGFKRPKQNYLKRQTLKPLKAPTSDLRRSTHDGPDDSMDIDSQL